VSGVGVSIEGNGMDIPLDQIVNLTQGVIPWVKAKPDWSQMNGNWLYWMSGVMDYQNGNLLDPYRLSSCSASGTLSLDIYTSAALVADGRMEFTLQFVDRYGATFDLAETIFSVADMQPNNWNNISIPLSADSYHDNLKFVGLKINATQVSPLLDAYFYVDNILIKHKN
jgi:hypothetical protein